MKHIEIRHETALHVVLAKVSFWLVSCPKAVTDIFSKFGFEWFGLLFSEINGNHTKIEFLKKMWFRAFLHTKPEIYIYVCIKDHRNMFGLFQATEKCEWGWYEWLQSMSGTRAHLTFYWNIFFFAYLRSSNSFFYRTSRWSFCFLIYYAALSCNKIRTPKSKKTYTCTQCKLERKLTVT